MKKIDNYDAFLEKVNIRNKTIHYIKTDKVIGVHLANYTYWEAWMSKYIHRFYIPNTNLVDAGGYIGTTSLLMSEVLSNTNNRVYTFEPIFNDILFKNIINNKLEKSIELFPCALSNEKGFTIEKSLDLSKNTNFGATSILFNKSINDEQNKNVSIYKLDDFHLSNVSILKIDVQKMEQEVLEGAFQLIQQCKPTIFVEIYDVNHFKNSKIFKQLNKIGYVIDIIPEGWNDYLLIVPPITTIPKQIFICDKVLTYIQKYSQDWKRLNPTYDIQLYDNVMCEDFLLKEFSKKHVNIFRFLKDGPIKADFWRVCILYRYGGVYADADAEPLVPIHLFLENNVDFLTCSSYGSNFNPNFIMAHAGDDILKKCIDTYLKMHDEEVPYSYWGWSIMTVFHKVLHLENYSKEDGIYYADTKKYQILKEIKETEFKNDHNVYKGFRIFNNRYADYNCLTHSFKK